jgi:hypothetical protein
MRQCERATAPRASLAWRCARAGPYGPSRGLWGEPGPGRKLAAWPNRVMSPISASRTSAVNGPTPGRAVRTLTRGSGRVWPRISASSRPVTDSRRR